MDTLKTIKSFTIDHDLHRIGFYLSNVSHNIYTYDLRTVIPNSGNYMSNKAMHSIEHLFATVIRNSEIKDKVVYFGPMGCRTGFYLLLLDVEYKEALEIIKNVIEKCLALDKVPGTERKECGNYLEHDLNEAKEVLKQYLTALLEIK